MLPRSIRGWRRLAERLADETEEKRAVESATVPVWVLLLVAATFLFVLLVLLR